jgi:hypothetical protein
VIGHPVPNLRRLDSPLIAEDLLDLLARDPPLRVVMLQVAEVAREPYDRSGVHRYA